MEGPTARSVSISTELRTELRGRRSELIPRGSGAQNQGMGTMTAPRRGCTRLAQSSHPLAVPGGGNLLDEAVRVL